MQSFARVVIAGGGIIGCSTAYHLAKMGCVDVVLLEKGELTSGSTWHAAGLVGQLRSSRNVTQMLKYSAELYDRLEQETGQPTGFRKVGGLRVARTPERMEELNRSATLAMTFGLPMTLHD
ncbi:MAG: FAD-binding oxidoreductase, partial [Deltaproteobacteria bacterium]|nr:FAD-binding oxidoreductase [Deltaproteobacteria bacterium]